VLTEVITTVKSNAVKAADVFEFCTCTQHLGGLLKVMLDATKSHFPFPTLPLVKVKGITVLYILNFDLDYFFRYFLLHR
jgi:hypothetical protein